MAKKIKIKHDDCPVVIVERRFQGRDQLVPGLYCAHHVVHFKWLSRQDARELEAMGVENLGPVKGE